MIPLRSGCRATVQRVANARARRRRRGARSAHGTSAGRDAGHVHTQVQRVGAGRRAPRRRAGRRPPPASVRGDHLVGAPVRGRARGRVAAVRVDLLRGLLRGRLADPRPPDEHARRRSRPRRGTRRRARGSAPVSRASRTRARRRSRRRGAPRSRSRPRSSTGIGCSRQLRDRGIAGERARRRRRRARARRARQRVAKRAVRSSIVVSMISKSAGSAPAATPRPTRPGMARREPRGLLDHERGRSQQQQQRARRRPTARHRVEREARGLQRVRQVAREPAVMLARHHAVEPVRDAASAACARSSSTICGAPRCGYRNEIDPAANGTSSRAPRESGITPTLSRDDSPGVWRWCSGSCWSRSRCRGTVTVAPANTSAGQRSPRTLPTGQFVGQVKAPSKTSATTRSRTGATSLPSSASSAVGLALAGAYDHHVSAAPSHRRSHSAFVSSYSTSPCSDPSIGCQPFEVERAHEAQPAPFHHARGTRR